MIRVNKMNINVTRRENTFSVYVVIVYDGTTLYQNYCRVFLTRREAEKYAATFGGADTAMRKIALGTMSFGSGTPQKPKYEKMGLGDTRGM